MYFRIFDIVGEIEEVTKVLDPVVVPNLKGLTERYPIGSGPNMIFAFYCSRPNVVECTRKTKKTFAL